MKAITVISSLPFSFFLWFLHSYSSSLSLPILILIESFSLLKRRFSCIVTYNMIILYNIMEPTLKMVSLESSWNKCQEVRTEHSSTYTRSLIHQEMIISQLKVSILSHRNTRNIIIINCWYKLIRILILLLIKMYDLKQLIVS